MCFLIPTSNRRASPSLGIFTPCVNRTRLHIQVRLRYERRLGMHGNGTQGQNWKARPKHEQPRCVLTQWFPAESSRQRPRLPSGVGVLTRHWVHSWLQRCASNPSARQKSRACTEWLGPHAMPLPSHVALAG